MFRKILAVTLACSMMAAVPVVAEELPEDYPLSSQIKDAVYMGDLREFSAELLDSDEEFTQDNLKDYDLTMINFWATWCGPCLMEMPELAEFEKTVPDNIKVIICCISYDSLDEVSSVLDEMGYEGDCIIQMHGDLAALSNNILSIPTTLFFDSEGNAVGSGVMGYQQNFSLYYTQTINSILKQMGLEEMGSAAQTETEETETEA